MVRNGVDIRSSRRVAAVLAALACGAVTGGRVLGAEPPPGSGETRICVHVFDDRNGDGTQQAPDEAGLGGWSVRVEGGRPAYLTTADDGAACTSVNPGSTSVQVPAQPGWAPTSRVSMRVRVEAGQTTDLSVGFRKEEAVGGRAAGSPAPEKAAEARPTGRTADLTVGAANPVRCKLVSVRIETASGTTNLVLEDTIRLGSTSLAIADVAEVRFWYEGPGGLPCVAFVTDKGAVIRMERTIRSLHVCAEVPGRDSYAYDWEPGNERGGPPPSLLRFVRPAPLR